jgi:glycosyltransferase involved in cell wall biosynthesis
VQREIFYPPSESELKAREEVPSVINPRGFRAYVRNDTFFKAIPLVLRSYPKVQFVCTAMGGEALAEKWVDQLSVRSSVTLTPEQTHAQMAHLFRKSLISVSPSEHDGTPNTLLEAMACGCFPIAGDIESLREWIRPGRNGLLVSSSNSQALADAIIKGLEARELRWSAAQHNLKLIAEKAEYLQVMAKARRFYRALIEKGGIR